MDFFSLLSSGHSPLSLASVREIFFLVRSRGTLATTDDEVIVVALCDLRLDTQ